MKFTTDLPDQPGALPFSKYRFILWDFDNTLYRETDYLFPAYEDLADYLSKKYRQPAARYAQFLQSTFLESGRTRLFNRLCHHFNIPESEIDHLLVRLRTVKPAQKISLYPKVEQALSQLAQQGRQMFVVTNGNLQQQRNKVSLVAWHGLDEHLQFVYTAALKPKPDRAAFDFIAAQFGVSAHESIMIGDTTTDEQFAVNSGIPYLDIHTTGWLP